LAVDLHRHTSPWQARPVKRVYIPKANGKQRPLGIPVLRDRAQQASVANALEPEWEARFEPRSYGFRPGRGCHDAIESIYWTLKGRLSKRQWVLDADLSAAFDEISHPALMDRVRERLGDKSVLAVVKAFLKAGILNETGQVRGTPRPAPRKGASFRRCWPTWPCLSSMSISRRSGPGESSGPSVAVTDSPTTG
jgi:RNA-directed DNA polymerase